MAHAEAFLRELQGLVAFEFYDMTEIFEAMFSLESSEALDIHFESVGYESSDSIINSGPIGMVIFLAPFFLLLAFILSRFCRRPRIRTFFSN